MDLITRKELYNYLKNENGKIDAEINISELNCLHFSKENINFSHSNKIGGSYTIEGTQWTIASMVAQEAGIPLLFPLLFSFIPLIFCPPLPFSLRNCKVQNTGRPFQEARHEFLFRLFFPFPVRLSYPVPVQNLSSVLLLSLYT